MFAVLEAHDQANLRLVPAEPHLTPLAMVQKLVQGTHLQLIPYRNTVQYQRPLFRAYINRNGLAQRLSFNSFAWSVLDTLGFMDMSRGYNAYCGDVVLLSAKGQALSEAEVLPIEQAIVAIQRPAPPSEWDTYPKMKQKDQKLTN